MCSVTIDIERKVRYKCPHKDVDGEEYISPAAGQRVGQKVLRVRSSCRDGMVPRVARAKSIESSPSRSRHRYQGREYHLQMTASQDRTRKVRLAYRTCSHHRTGFFVEASSLKWVAPRASIEALVPMSAGMRDGTGAFYLESLGQPKDRNHSEENDECCARSTTNN